MGCFPSHVGCNYHWYFIQNSAWNHLASPHLGRSSLCLVNTRFHSFYWTVHGQRAKSTCSLPCILLLHLYRMACSFVLKVFKKKYSNHNNISKGNYYPVKRKMN